MMRTTASSSSCSWIINCWYINFLIILFALYSLTPTAFSSYSTSTANLSTTWTLKMLTVDSYYVYDNSRDVTGIFNPILVTEETKVKSRFALGFFCQGDGYPCTSHFFAIFILMGGYSSLPSPSPLIWSANRDHPVKNKATLNFTAAGELVLRDADGTMVWSTNTAGKSVIGMNFTDAGNLVLYDVNHHVVWQSFDHPTDCLLPGQPLFQGQKLISSVSATNIQKGIFSLEVTDGGLFAYIDSNPPQAYFSYNDPSGYNEKNINKGNKSYVRILNGSLSLFIRSAEPSDPDAGIPITQASSAQYMKLMPDGHLKVFEYQFDDWKEVADDLLTYATLGECGYPLACGRNALCSQEKQCICPVSNSPGIQYFQAVNNREPNLGCSEITPLACNATQHQDFIVVENVTSITFTADLEDVNVTKCKQACLKNCSCKAALFRYYNDLSGECYLCSCWVI